jgi:hypothetical protein
MLLPCFIRRIFSSHISRVCYSYSNYYNQGVCKRLPQGSFSGRFRDGYNQSLFQPKPMISHQFSNFATHAGISLRGRRHSNGYIRRNTCSTYYSTMYSGVVMYFQPKSLMLYSIKPSVISTLLIPTSTVGFGAHKMRLPCVRTAYPPVVRLARVYSVRKACIVCLETS